MVLLCKSHHDRVESVEMSDSRPLSIAPIGWESDSDEPVRKKSRVQDKPRFQLLSTNVVQDLCSPKPPKSTEQCTKWALKNFHAWKQERNHIHSEEPVPDDLLETASPEEISRWLAHYVAEMRNTRRKPYPPKTIYQLLTGILRHLRLTQPHNCPNFLDRSDLRFIKLHNAIDSVQATTQRWSWQRVQACGNSNQGRREPAVGSRSTWYKCSQNTIAHCLLSEWQELLLTWWTRTQRAQDISADASFMSSGRLYIH